MCPGVTPGGHLEDPTAGSKLLHARRCLRFDVPSRPLKERDEQLRRLRLCPVSLLNTWPQAFTSAQFFIWLTTIVTKFFAAVSAFQIPV